MEVTPMKRLKRIAAALLSALTAMLLLPVQAHAAGNIELNRDMSLNVSYVDGKTYLSGAQFDIYLVATVDKCGELTTTETFSLFNVDIRGKNDEAWNKVASTLDGYILRDKIAPTDSAKTNAQGLAAFPSTQEHLTPGLYLVKGQRHKQDGTIYEAATFMVMVPGIDMEANAWIYDVTVNAKFISYPEQVVDPDATTRKVLKVWKDSGHEQSRPKKVVVQLIRDSEIVDTVTLTRRYVDFSYVDGNEYVFMDKEDYTPYTFTKDQIEEELLFMPEGGMPDMQVLTWDGQLLALELPQTVDLEIVETAPGIKGASASARNKPATLSTGLVIQVPEYLSPGEKIRIHIEERRYMGRAD